MGVLATFSLLLHQGKRGAEVAPGVQFGRPHFANSLHKRSAPSYAESMSITEIAKTAVNVQVCQFWPAAPRQ
jgi:hypothetical protein